MSCYSGSSTDPTVNGFHWNKETVHVEIVILGKAQVLQITKTVALFYPRVQMSHNSVEFSIVIFIYAFLYVFC